MIFRRLEQMVKAVSGCGVGGSLCVCPSGEPSSLLFCYTAELCSLRLFSSEQLTWMQDLILWDLRESLSLHVRLIFSQASLPK